MYVEYCGAPQRKGKGDNTMKKAAFILALLLGVAAGCGQSAGEASVQSVSMICGLGSAGMTDRFAGVVSALGETNIKKDDSMTIGEIKVKAGDAVNVGDVLFTYDMSQLEIDLEAITTRCRKPTAASPKRTATSRSCRRTCRTAP